MTKIKRQNNTNVYELKKDYCILKITSKTYGLIEVLIDLDDVEKCKKYTWGLGNDKKKTFFITNYEVGKLSRYLLNSPKNVPLINKNGDFKDCRKENLKYSNLSEIALIKNSNKNIYEIKEGYAIIKMLSNKYGYFETKIDIEDVEKCKKYIWHIHRKTRYTYYVESTTYGKLTHLHRLVMNCPDDKVIDHINHDGLDNRKENLKICTDLENARNKDSYINQSTKYIGIMQLYKVNIFANGKNKHLGYFRNLEDAIEARRQAELKYWGEEALKINDENRKRTGES